MYLRQPVAGNTAPPDLRAATHGLHSAEGIFIRFHACRLTLHRL